MSVAIEQWREEVAKEYVDKLMSEETDWVLKHVSDILWLFKSEIELKKNVKKELWDFLLSDGLFSDYKWFFLRWLLSWDSQEKLKNAKDRLKNSTTKEEAREKLWLDWWWTNVPLKKNKEQIQEREQQKQEKKESREYLGNFNISEKYIIGQAEKYWVTDKNQVAYILATVRWESNFKNIKEIGWNKKYWKDGYYGRGFVQLTHEYNYKKFTDIIKEQNLKFKDNFWKDLTNEELNLVKNPDSILKSNDLAAFILVHWMKEWLFTWKKISDYINEDEIDFQGARRVIGWAYPDKYQKYAKEYLSQMDMKEKSNEILKYSETLLFWDSHVWGMKSLYKWKSEHFDGYDTWQLYKKLSSWNVDLSWVKSIILYTWSNDITKNTIGELNDNLAKIKDFLDEKNISLVLCKIPYNKSKSENNIDKINNIIEDFSKKNKLTLFDLNSNIKLSDADYSGDWVHLNRTWYNGVIGEIDKSMAA